MNSVIRNLKFVILFSLPVQAQIGGQEVFSFLRMPTTARTMGLGGVNISSGWEQDVNMAAANPGLLSKEQSGVGSINYLPVYGGIQHTQVAYNQIFKGSGVFGANLQYLNYGKLDETDAAGNVIGSFQVSEYALGITHARTSGAFSVGMTLKLAGSNLANYSAYAVMADLGGVFKHPQHDLTFALTVKNLGAVFKRYAPDSQLLLPLDVQLGGSFKPKNMPVRFSLTAQRLTRFDIAYNDPAQNFQLDLNGNRIPKEISFADKVFRHFVFGAELILSKNFNLRGGYNYLIRRELRLDNTSGGAGFSFGLMLKIKQFEFAYSRGGYHAAGGANCLTLSVNTKSFVRKEVEK
jgi:hypothetical protein